MSQYTSDEANLMVSQIPNFNRMQGTANDLTTLNSICGISSTARAQLLAQNAAFKQVIVMNIAAKNKTDYPPAGPTSPDKKAFQNQKIKYLLQAIGESGDLSSLGVSQSTMAGFNTLGTWGANAVRGTKRAVSSPSTAASSTGKSVKSMFGWGGGRKRVKKGTRKAKKSRKSRK